MIMSIGEKHPNKTNATSINAIEDFFTSSPCLLHDCLTFIGVSFFINNYY